MTAQGCKLTIIVPERDLDDDTESPPPRYL